MAVVQEKQMDLKGKDFLTLADFSPETIQHLLNKAVEIKAEKMEGKPTPYLQGKILGLIFEKPSTRTRVSFEAGMLQLGGQAIFLNSQDSQLGRGEPISDTAQVLSEYLDGIMIRTFSHERVEELAKHSSIPVINGLTDKFHPCQALADLLTVQEVKGSVKGKKIAYIGDGNNVANSLMIAASKMGADFSIASPEGYEPEDDVVALAVNFAEKSGSTILITNDPKEAVENADVIYTDVWTSMGQEKENEIRMEKFKNYQVNDELVKHAKEDYMFLHCLPAHRGEEVAPSVIDGKHSYIFQQAGNRLHAQKALMVELLG